MFARRLRSLRGDAGLTQGELGDIIGRSQSLVSNWETDKSTPDVDELTLLCEHFGVDAATLVGQTALIFPPGPRPTVPKRQKKRGANAGA